MMRKKKPYFRQWVVTLAFLYVRNTRYFDVDKYVWNSQFDEVTWLDWMHDQKIYIFYGMVISFYRYVILDLALFPPFIYM